MTKAQKAERQEAIARLREWIKPGDTVYTILDHVSRSGMMRHIRVVVPQINDQRCSCGGCASGVHYSAEPDVRRQDFIHPNRAVSKALGIPQAAKGDGLKIGGCGMDMGFHLVNSLSQVLYGGRQCDCGAWRDEDGGAHSWSDYHASENYTARGSWRYQYVVDCAICGGTGNVIGTGYQCLGKGKCPSNYHVNHRDRLRCEGIEIDGKRRHCYKPDRWGRYADQIPEDWPRGADHVIEVEADGDEPAKRCTIDGPLLACLSGSGEDGRPYEVCPTCQGAGDVPNPDGPERFDLLHTDGYAIRHRWL